MPNTKKTPHRSHKKWGKYSTKFQFSCTTEMKEFLQKKTASWLRNLIEKNYDKTIQKSGKNKDKEI
jgi:hypothetical protein